MQEPSRCPFCGNRPVIRAMDYDTGMYFATIRSVMCVAEECQKKPQTDWFYNEQSAITEWEKYCKEVAKNDP